MLHILHPKASYSNWCSITTFVKIQNSYEIEVSLIVALLNECTQCNWQRYCLLWSLLLKSHGGCFLVLREC